MDQSTELLIFNLYYIMKHKFIASILALAPLVGYSAITLNMQVAGLLNSSGQSITAGSFGAVIVDQSGNGISDPLGAVFSAGQLFGGDNLVLGVSSASDVTGEGNIGFDLAAVFELSTSLTVGDKLYFIWFPSVTNAAAPIGAATSYGLFTSEVITDLSNIAWAVPADGTYSLNAYPVELGGSYTPTQLRANNITAGSAVPEPSSFAAIAGLGILGVVATRRRRSA